MAAALSLHIGVNRVDAAHYAGWSGPLRSCEADAEDLEALASRRGFATSRLLTVDATRDRVQQAISAAAASLSPGGIFLLSYSGHGGTLPDTSGDEDDQQDETWCLFDGELLDDELHEHWAAFSPEARVLVLSDSCHSGSVVRRATRGTGGTRHPVSMQAPAPGAPVFRAMPETVATRTFRQNRAFYDDIRAALPASDTPIRATVRLISGCQDHQLSLDGLNNGLFTAALLRTWSDGAFLGTYADFHAAIAKTMPASQKPNHLTLGVANAAFDNQSPFTI